MEQAKAKEVTNDATAKEAVAIRKLITSHRTEVKNARLAITRNFDSVKSQFIDAEKDVLAPAEEALENISQKILDYQEEQERLAKQEAARRRWCQGGKNDNQPSGKNNRGHRPRHADWFERNTILEH